MMKITSVKINNILGVEEAQIQPDGNIIEIKGKNGSGKTSRVQALLDVLGISDYSTLLRNGESKGKTVIELDDMRLTKSYTEKNPKGVLKVEGKVVGTDSFSKISSPAKVLKSLINPNSVDPVRLLTATNKELVDAVLEAIPMKTDCDRMSELSNIDVWEEDTHALVAISEAQQQIVMARRDVNRDMKSATISADELVATLPEEYESNSDEILSQIEEQQSLLENLGNQERSKKRKIRTSFKDAINEANIEVENLEEELEELHKKIAEAKSKSSALYAKMEVECEKVAEGIVKDQEDVNRTISDLQKSLSMVEVYRNTEQRIDNYNSNIRKLKRESKRYDDQLASLQSYKEELCSDLPVEGLELTDGKLSMHGIPFETLNTAARIDLVLELAKLGAGKLGLVVLDNSEHLDSKTYKEFLDKASKTDLQFIVARVSDSELEVA